MARIKRRQAMSKKVKRLQLGQHSQASGRPPDTLGRVLSFEGKHGIQMWRKKATENWTFTQVTWYPSSYITLQIHKLCEHHLRPPLQSNSQHPTWLTSPAALLPHWFITQYSYTTPAQSGPYAPSGTHHPGAIHPYVYLYSTTSCDQERDLICSSQSLGTSSIERWWLGIYRP